MFGFNQTETTLFSNEYDAAGNVTRITRSGDSGVMSIEYLFWGTGGFTGVHTIDMALRAKDRCYDLSGRRMNGTPNRKGLFIIGGKKTLVK